MNERKNVLIGKIGKAVKTKNIHIETGGGADLVLYSTWQECVQNIIFILLVRMNCTSVLKKSI